MDEFVLGEENESPGPASRFGLIEEVHVLVSSQASDGKVVT